MSTLEKGEKFSVNQPIAFTKNFDRNGAYCAGKNVSIAIMNYDGLKLVPFRSDPDRITPLIR